MEPFAKIGLATFLGGSLFAAAQAATTGEINVAGLVQLASGFGVAVLAVVGWWRYAIYVAEQHAVRLERDEKVLESLMKGSALTAQALTTLAGKMEQVESRLANIERRTERCGGQ